MKDENNMSGFTVPNPYEPESNVGSAENGESADECENASSDGSVTVERGGEYLHCLTVIGQIEGHYALSGNAKTTKYEHVIPRIVAVENNPDVSGLLIILNTVGGDLEAGLAISELISGMKKPTVSLVLGGGHSIGIPLAVSATRSFIAPSATMTVHPVRMTGLVLGVPETLRYLEKMEERVVDFVVRNSAVKADRFRQLMKNADELIFDFGTVLGGEQAVSEGIIDRVGGLSDALDCLESLSKEYKRHLV